MPTRFYIVALALCLYFAAHAVEADSIAGPGYDLTELVVTGTRTPKSLAETPVQTRLITAEEVRRADATDISDLLRQELPGVEFSYAMNQQTNLNLGGFAGRSVLFLLDGERLAGETMDNTDFSRLSMNGVDRIEIVRGAASALYGSDATGGVVNIITREADKPWRVNLQGRGGSHGQWRTGLSAVCHSTHIANTFSADFNRIGTYKVCLDTSDECDFRTVHGSHSFNIRDRLVYTPLPYLRFTARAGYYFKERLYNVDTPDRYRDVSAGLKANWDINDRSTLEMAYTFDEYDKSDYIREHGLDIRDYSNVQHTLRALYSLEATTRGTLTAGADFMRDYLQSYQFGPGESHTQLSADLFAQYDHTFNHHWELVGAAHFDWMSEGSTLYATGKLSARYRTGSFTLRGGYGGGFRAPTLKEKYMNFNMADIFDIHGNPDLHAEKSHNFYANAEYVWHNLYFTLGGTYNLVNDRITTSGILYDNLHQPYLRYLNVKRMHVYGLDAQVRGRWTCGIDASIAYCFTHEKSAGGGVSQYCPARPHSLNAKVGWSHHWHTNYATELTLSGRLLSAVSYKSMYMYEPFEERMVTNPAYTLWKLQLVQRVWRGISVTLAVDNLLNYVPRVYTFNAPVTTGAIFYAGLSLDIDAMAGR